MPEGTLPKATSLARRRTNVTLSDQLVREVRGLGINVSQACEQGLAGAVRQAREQAWLGENKAALEAWNDYVDEHGLPLAEYRQF